MKHEPISPNNPTTQWSAIGKPILILFPILIIIAGIVWADSLQLRSQAEGSTPSVALLGLAMASLAMRIGGVVFLLLSLLVSLRKTPPESFPNIFKKQINTIDK